MNKCFPCGNTFVIYLLNRFISVCHLSRYW